MTNIIIICGGPSAERGISLNSARSIYDHLVTDDVQFEVLYIDQKLDFYKIKSASLYSNTPSDFDFKLANTACMTNEEIKQVVTKADIAFPCIHGEFGEDGQLQEMLEEFGVTFVGSSSKACCHALNKYAINQKLANAQLPALDIAKLDLETDTTPLAPLVSAFVDKHPNEKYVVKPLSGGSSIGVAIVDKQQDILEHCETLKNQYGTRQAVLEEYCDGQEFTVVVVQNAENEPIALPITEVKVQGVFGFREKYLPTAATMRHCPPEPESYSDKQIAIIRKQAEQIFTLFGMRDIARFDGFLTVDNKVYFNDLNPVSGMEQNSFFFQQASRIGWRHKDLLRHVVNLALARAGKSPLKVDNHHSAVKEPVWVLFGGDSGEKEVSVMSGTNVWLKLAKSNYYQSSPFLLTGDTVWKLPYAFCLDHTVFEIQQNCEQAKTINNRVQGLAKEIKGRLKTDNFVDTWGIPERMDLESFLQGAEKAGAFVFLGLHGGDGENGTLQKKLDVLQVNYSGANAASSKLCMDKLSSGKKIIDAKMEGIIAASKLNINVDEHFNPSDANRYYQQGMTVWEETKDMLGTNELGFKSRDLLIKPKADGCSLGIVRLKNAKDLATYFQHMGKNEPLPPFTFAAHEGIIEMNFDTSNGLIIEPFVETVKLQVQNHKILPKVVKGWVELTVGVVYQEGSLHSLVPSITVAEDAVLSLEEKFQGGTGVNLTPPPVNVVNTSQCQLIRSQIEKMASVLGIDGYARIDIFFNTVTNDIIFIEANTLPGLTPSTVIYHQALADSPSRNPTEFLQHLVQTKVQNKNLEIHSENLWHSSDIAEAVNGKLVGDPFIASGISIDSRLTEAGQIFVTLGEGHKFVANAMSRGAVATLTSHPVKEPYILVDEPLVALEKLGVAARIHNAGTKRIGITGSVGKTSVTQGLAKVLASAGVTHRPVSSYNNHIGVPVTLIRMPREAQFGVFEMGMNNPGELRKLTQFVKPHIALVTKIGSAHTANFPEGVEGIAKAKAEIFEGLDAGGVAIINRDNGWYGLLQDKAIENSAEILTFSLSQKADAQLISYQKAAHGARLVIRLGEEELQLNVAQRGRHWTENCLAILLVVKALNVPMSQALPALEKIAPLKGRGEIRNVQINGNKAVLIDDSYNANPDSMRAAFNNLKGYSNVKRRVAVLTDMMELSDAGQMHIDLAQDIVNANIDVVYLAGEHMKGLYEALPKEIRGHWTSTALELLPSINRSIAEGDAILVKGSNGSGAMKIAAALLSHKLAIKKA